MKFSLLKFIYFLLMFNVYLFLFILFYKKKIKIKQIKIQSKLIVFICVNFAFKISIFF